MNYPEWAMCGIDWDEKPFPKYPVLAQPKLNGVRAKWDHRHKLFISRQGKVFPELIIPHLYQKARRIQPSVSIDGELYGHDMDFQTIAGMVTPNRNEPDPDVSKIDFFAFDTIDNKTPSQQRVNDIKQWPTGLKTVLCDNEEEVSYCFRSFLQQGFEGAMVRLLDTYYMVGRVKYLIKIKPWYHEQVKIIGFVKGYGKLRNSLGALDVQLALPDRPIYFKVGGGKITEEQRQYIWNNKANYLHQTIPIRYREKSQSGKPLQPQIVEIKEL